VSPISSFRFRGVAGSWWKGLREGAVLSILLSRAGFFFRRLRFDIVWGHALSVPLSLYFFWGLFRIISTVVLVLIFGGSVLLIGAFFFLFLGH